MSDRDTQVEILRKEFWRLQVMASSSPKTSHAAKANAERCLEIESDLGVLGSDVGYGERYTPPAFVNAASMGLPT